MVQNMFVAGQWGETIPQLPGEEDLAALDAWVEGCPPEDNHQVKIIGRGSVSTVLQWRDNLVVKPLPLFPSRSAFYNYSSLLEKQFNILTAGNVGVLATTLQGRQKENGAWAGYIIQPKVSDAQLLPQFLRNSHDEQAVDVLVLLGAHLDAVVSHRFGLDADITNWCVDSNGDLRLLDTSSPLVRDADGRLLLDLDLFLASIPRALRFPLRRFVVPRLVERFFERRRLFIDILSGFYSEHLSHLLPQVIARWNSIVEKEISESEVLRYKRRNELMWRALEVLDRRS